MPWQPDDCKTLFGVDPPPCECSDAMKISKTRRFRDRRARQHFATSTAVRDEAADTTTNSLGLKFGMDTQCLPRAQSDRMNPSVVQRRLPVPSGKREVGRRRDCRDSREVKAQQARIKPHNDLSGRTSFVGEGFRLWPLRNHPARYGSDVLNGKPRVASAASLVGVPSAHINGTGASSNEWRAALGYNGVAIARSPCRPL
jgi:hypothetical protein